MGSPLARSPFRVRDRLKRMLNLSTRQALVPGLLAAVFGLAATGTASAAETIKLDTTNPGNSLFSKAIPAATAPLAAGQPYVITISGTATIWPIIPGGGQALCGVAEASVVEPSPGVGPRVGTWDAATVFASGAGWLVAPSGNACVDLTLPRSTSDRAPGIEFNSGAGWAKPVPFGGNRVAPRTDHTYSYEVTGNGAPLGFRFVDAPVNDNSGVFTITARTAAECAAVNCLGTQSAQNDRIAQPVVPADPGSVNVKGIQQCGLERVLSVRLKRAKGVKFTRTVYYLNGKKLRTVKGKKIFIGRTGVVRAQKFRKLPTGTITLKVIVTTTSGQKTSVTQKFVRCMPRIKAKPVVKTKHAK